MKFGRYSVLALFVAALLWSGVLFGSFSFAAEKQKKSSSPPNIVIFLADDLGYSDLGCYGGEIQTPHIDSLAAGGLRFTQFYNTARCWPTRTCILTGYYAQQVRMDPPQGSLPEWTRVLPHYLSPLGYRSYHSGKWHLHGAPQAVADGGFDRSYLLLDQDRHFAPKRSFLDDQPLPEVKSDEGFYGTKEIASRGIQFLQQHAKEHADDPFFMYMAFTAPHFPLHALQEDIDRYRDRYLDGWDKIRQQRYERQQQLNLDLGELSAPERLTIPSWNTPAEKLLSDIGPGEAPYAVSWDDLTDEQRRFQAEKMAIHAAMVDRIDQEIGRVIQQLKAMNRWDNTIIFFLSDNGASAEQLIRGDLHDKNVSPGSAGSYLCLGPGWSTSCNTPFRRHKSWVHEGGCSTPLVVHWPEGISARGALRTDMGHCIDFVPTILDLAGAKTVSEFHGKPAPSLPGRSLVPAFNKPGTIQREYLFFHHEGNRALREGDWKLVSAADNNNAWELYNLAEDRAESHNLADQQPNRVKKMAARWTSLQAEFERQAGPPPPGKQGTKKKKKQ